MSFFIVSASKRSNSNKVGIHVGFLAGGKKKIVVTKMSQTSIFRGTALRPGNEIVSINNTVVRGMSLHVVQTILRSIEGEVIIQARAGCGGDDSSTPPKSRPALRHSSLPSPVSSHALATTLQLNLETKMWNQYRSQVPNQLKALGVPLAVWEATFDVVDRIMKKQITGAKELRAMEAERQELLAQYNSPLVCWGLAPNPDGQWRLRWGYVGGRRGPTRRECMEARYQRARRTLDCEMHNEIISGTSSVATLFQAHGVKVMPILNAQSKKSQHMGFEGISFSLPRATPVPHPTAPSQCYDTNNLCIATIVE